MTDLSIKPGGGYLGVESDMSTKISDRTDATSNQADFTENRSIFTSIVTGSAVEHRSFASSPKTLVFALAGLIEPDQLARRRWYRNAEVSALNGLTPREAVEQGQGEDLLALLFQWIVSEAESESTSS